MIIASTYFLPL